MADETLLRELFGLLILAHYRTTPGDLRVLLDSPNLQVQLLRVAGAVVGCALVAEEGALSDALAEGVWQGVRRPTGHLLPQALIAHEGYAEVAPWRAWRVVRIVIHPDCQQQGLGTALLDALVDQARRAGVDYLGASFAATVDLLGYWRCNGFLPLRVGDQLDPVSGSHAVLVLRPLSAPCKTWFAHARQRYGERLRYRLPGNLRQLPVALLPALFADLAMSAPDPEQRRRLAGFAYQRRSLESTLIELDRLLLATVAQWPAAGWRIAISSCWWRGSGGSSRRLKWLSQREPGLSCSACGSWLGGCWSGLRQHPDAGPGLDQSRLGDHQVVAKADPPPLIAVDAGQGTQGFGGRAARSGQRVPRNQYTALAGLDQFQLHLIDGDALPVIFRPGLGTANHQVGAKAAHLGVGGSGIAQRLQRGFAGQQQGIGIGKKHRPLRRRPARR